MIDGFNLGLEKGTGVATYARNLSYALRDLACDVGVLYGGRFNASDDPLLQEVLFFDSRVTDGPLVGGRAAAPRQGARAELEHRVRGAGDRARSSPIRSSSRLPHYDSIWNAPDLYQKAAAQFELFALDQPSALEAASSTFAIGRIRCRCAIKGVPNIYTLHDLVPLRLPYTTLDKKAKYLRLVKWICSKADHIVTVSENSKRDIVDLLGVDPEKVTNTYEAVSDSRGAIATSPTTIVRREIEGTFGLEYKEYFLFFGSIEPKKNIGRMIQGYLTSGVDDAARHRRRAGLEVRARAPVARSARRSHAAARAAEAAARSCKLEYAPFALLVSLIRGAKAVLFPSLYEGFGLPVLESMTLGTPVLTSNTSSIPEIAGDAALMVDPYDPRAISEAIRALDENEPLRKELARKGVLQAERFSERAYAERLLGVYDAVLRGQ